MITFNGRNYERKPNPKSRTGLEGITIRLCDLQDVCEVVAHKRYPNASFSDDECVAWEIVARCARDLGIDF